MILKYISNYIVKSFLPQQQWSCPHYTVADLQKLGLLLPIVDEQDNSPHGYVIHSNRVLCGATYN